MNLQRLVPIANFVKCKFSLSGNPNPLVYIITLLVCIIIIIVIFQVDELYTAEMVAVDISKLLSQKS